MAIYDPERAIYLKGDRRAYPIIGVELHAKGLTIITSGDVRDEIVRWSVVDRDGTEMTDRGVVITDGNKTPLFYPDRNQVIIECQAAHELWQKMIGEAVVNSSQMATLSKHDQNTAFTLMQLVPGNAASTPATC